MLRMSLGNAVRPTVGGMVTMGPGREAMEAGCGWLRSTIVGRGAATSASKKALGLDQLASTRSPAARIVAIPKVATEIAEAVLHPSSRASAAKVARQGT